jgi:hypothetical protein
MQASSQLINCDKCQQQFEPKSHVEPNDMLHAFLATTHFKQICSTCQLHLNALLAKASNHHFSTIKNELKENIHYYGFWVFTEYYHVLRGYCCKNACRHCAYGFKKEMA